MAEERTTRTGWLFAEKRDEKVLLRRDMAQTRIREPQRRVELRHFIWGAKHH